MTGHGVFTWPNGDRAEGQFSDGKLDGNGTMKYSNGNFYAGDWRNGEMDGRGEMKYTDKSHYDGLWVNGRQSGSGTFVFSNGNMYIGEFENGERRGDGAAVAFFYESEGKWCIENCSTISSEFAIVSGEFPATPESQSVKVKQCGSDQIKCQTLVNAALLEYQKEQAKKLADEEHERALKAAEAEKEKARKEAAALAEKKHLADMRHKFLYETGTDAQIYMDADQLEASKDYIQASDVYRIVVTRFPDSKFAVAAMTRLGAMRDKLDRQAAEEKRQALEDKRLASEAEARNKETQLRKEDIEARKAEAEARKSEAAATRAAVQNNQNSGIGRSAACIACDQLDGVPKMICKAGACN